MTEFNPNFQFLFGNESSTLEDQAKCIILPIPMEKTTSFMKGTKNGPEKIIQNSVQLEFFDPELEKENCDIGIFTDWEIAKLGDALNQKSSEDIVGLINERVSYWLARDKYVLSLGGEHTITAGTFPPFHQKYKDQITILHFDAHADLKDTYEGTPYSHACALRRVCDLAPLVSVGIRSVDRDEFNYAKAHPTITTFYAHTFPDNPNWTDEVIDAIKTPYVYVTFDLDGLDHSVIPGLGTPQPGGVGWYEALKILKAVGRKSKIVGADVNEICPEDHVNLSSFVAATLVYKLIGYSFN